MAQEIKIEIDPESYAEVYGKLLALYKMAEKIDSVMQSAQHSVHLTAFGVFCGGAIFGAFIMFVVSAMLSGGR